jgi:hypothetical protein
MTPQQRTQPRWLPSTRDSVDVFQRQFEAEIVRFVGPNSGRFNRVGR